MNRSQIEAEQLAYRNATPAFLGRGIDRLTHPLGSAIANRLPKRMVEGVLKGIDRAASVGELVSMDHDPADISASRKAAENVERYARTINASSGAAAGLGGALTAGADIPATIAIALRNIRDTGRAYGFEGKGKRERLFRLQILEIAASDEHSEKIGRLEALEAEIDASGDLAPVESRSIEPLIDQAVERVSRAIALGSIRRRAGMVVPLLGSAIGGFVNSQFQRDVSRAARYAFQARRLRTME